MSQTHTHTPPNGTFGSRGGPWPPCCAEKWGPPLHPIPNSHPSATALSTLMRGSPLSGTVFLFHFLILGDTLTHTRSLTLTCTHRHTTALMQLCELELGHTATLGESFGSVLHRLCLCGRRDSLWLLSTLFELLSVSQLKSPSTSSDVAYASFLAHFNCLVIIATGSNLVK